VIPIRCPTGAGAGTTEIRIIRMGHENGDAPGRDWGCLGLNFN